MKNKYLTLTLAISFFTGGIIAHNIATDIKQYHAWHNERQVIEITIEPGDTLYSYAEKYAPTWMDIRDYCEAVKELNGTKNSSLQAFQNYKLYI